MNFRDIHAHANIVRGLVNGDFAPDPLMAGDADLLSNAADIIAESIPPTSEPGVHLSTIIAAAYSLGARHALEQTERWTLAPAAEADECDLGVELPPVRHPPLTVPSDYPE